MFILWNLSNDCITYRRINGYKIWILYSFFVGIRICYVIINLRDWLWFAIIIWFYILRMHSKIHTCAIFHT